MTYPNTCQQICFVFQSEKIFALLYYAESQTVCNAELHLRNTSTEFPHACQRTSAYEMSLGSFCMLSTVQKSDLYILMHDNRQEAV